MVRLADIIEALETASDERRDYLNRQTGEIHSIDLEVFRFIEAGGTADKLPQWQRPQFDAANLVHETDRMVQLPTLFDIHEWSIMERFARPYPREQLRDAMLDAVHGSGAFRMFKSTLRRWGIEREWFDYRDNALRQIAIDWCEEGGIGYSES